jgi:hypothetical protein
MPPVRWRSLSHAEALRGLLTRRAAKRTEYPTNDTHYVSDAMSEFEWGGDQSDFISVYADSRRLETRALTASADDASDKIALRAECALRQDREITQRQRLLLFRDAQPCCKIV